MTYPLVKLGRVMGNDITKKGADSEGVCWGGRDRRWNHDVSATCLEKEPW